MWSEDEDITGFVPRASVSVAFLLVLGCLGLFLAFIRLITFSMRVANAISEIGEETMALAARIYPVQSDDAGPVQGPGWSPRPGDPGKKSGWAAMVRWCGSTTGSWCPGRRNTRR